MKMAPASIEDVFNVQRLPSGFQFIFLLFYFPLGTFICILRLLFCIQIGIILLLLPKGSVLRKIILRIHGTILGMVIFVEDQEKSPGFKVLLCNSISNLDSLLLESVEHHVLVSKAKQFPLFLHWLMGYPNFGNDSPPHIARKFKDYLDTDSQRSLLVFPEEATTNGITSLLKFSSWPFENDVPYQPVVLTARRPSFLPVKLTVIDAGFWSDFLWMLFVPYTVIHVKYLPKIQRHESASSEDLAKTVNQKMADSLKLEPSQFDFNDKNEFIKRLKRDQEEKNRAPSASVTRHQQIQRQPFCNDKMDRMVQQVKDVLPQVPINVIRRDILKSKSVDSTLANILEGNVSYTPLTSEEAEIEKKRELEKKLEIQKRKESDLASCIKNKGLSYQERKTIMIEEARRRYLEKHPEYSL